nr:hypothetical protein [Massilia sp. PDC64]
MQTDHLAGRLLARGPVTPMREIGLEQAADACARMLVTLLASSSPAAASWLQALASVASLSAGGLAPRIVAACQERGKFRLGEGGCVRRFESLRAQRQGIGSGVDVEVDPRQRPYIGEGFLEFGSL